jgi:polysaccharide biosynthesis/export protein
MSSALKYLIFAACTLAALCVRPAEAELPDAAAQTLPPADGRAVSTPAVTVSPFRSAFEAPLPGGVVKPAGDHPAAAPAVAADPNLQRLLRQQMQTRQGRKGERQASEQQPATIRAITAPKGEREPGLRERDESPKEAASDVEKFFSEGDRTLTERKAQPLRTDGLVQFGYSFFEGGKESFSPLTDIPVGADYVVGPGDTVIVTLSGSIEGTYPLDVNRSGEVTLPKSGAVRVWGVTFGEIPELLRTSLARSFRNFQLDVTMGKLRTMKVYVVGEVVKPGDYDVSALSTVINALAAAGGPTKNGSLRRIGIRRGGRMVETLDLYRFFLTGDKTRDVRLQSGDVVFVPVIGPVAAVAGNVRRPGVYELAGEETLKGLVEMAGGVVSTGSLQRVQIARVEAHDSRSVLDFSLGPGSGGAETAMAGIPVRDLDHVRILGIDETLKRYVKVDGYIQYPGIYAFTQGMHFGDVVKREWLLPEYCEAAAEITRYSPPDFRPESIIVHPGKALAGDPSENVTLQEFDVIRLFSRWEMEEMPKVFLGGEVQRPGEFRLQERMTVRDLIVKGGNLKQTAYRKNAEVTRLRRDGSTVTSFPILVELDEALRGNPKENILLEPFDHVMVRKIPEWAEETERYVTMKGELMFPGTYPVYKGEKLSSVIRRAGGFTPKSYLNGAKLTRKVVAQLQQQRMDEVIARTEENIAEKQQELAAVASSKEELEATKTALDGLRRSVEKLKTVKAEGRIAMELRSLEDLAGSEYDLELQGGDVLEIPQSPGAVTVVGEVYSPTTFIHRPGEKIGFYLEKAGGPTSGADESEMYVIRADGSVRSSAQEKGIFFGRFESLGVTAGDTIVVPKKLEKIAWMREIKDIAGILGQVALMGGVMVAAGL